MKKEYDTEILLELSEKPIRYSGDNFKEYVGKLSLLECENDKLLDLIGKFKSYKEKNNKNYTFDITYINFDKMKPNIQISIVENISNPVRNLYIKKYRNGNTCDEVCFFSYKGENCKNIHDYCYQYYNKFCIRFDSANLPPDIYDFDNCIKKLEKLNILSMTIFDYYFDRIPNFTYNDNFICADLIDVDSLINEYTISPPLNNNSSISIEPRLAAKLDKYTINTDGTNRIICNKNGSLLYNSDSIDRYSFDIENVKINKDTIIVFWKSGDKTIVTHKPESKDDKFDIEKAIYAAFTKKALSFGNTAKERSIDNIVSKCKEMIDKSIEKNKKIEAKKKKNNKYVY